jgi:hypothetical protein
MLSLSLQMEGLYIDDSPLQLDEELNSALDHGTLSFKVDFLQRTIRTGCSEDGKSSDPQAYKKNRTKSS